MDQWYPRCYDLGDFTDFEDFIEDFKMTKVESVLISYLKGKVDLGNPEERMKVRLSLVIIERKIRDILTTLG